LKTTCRAARRSSAVVVAVASAALALLAPAPRAQDVDVETWAKLLVDHPLAGSGDRDRVVHSWLELLGEEPGHPLAEATLQILSRLEAGDVADSQALAEQVAALDGAGLDPWATHLLHRLQGNLAARRAPVSELGQDRHPDQLSRFAVLGPLPPFDDPLAFRTPRPELTAPGFAAAHAAPDGELRWLALRRSPLRECVLPEAAVDPVTGWALLATCFETAQGGPAWLEVELPRALSDDSLFGGAGGNRARNTPGYALAVNEGAPAVVELAGRESASRRMFPVLLRAGRNRVVLQVSLDARTAVALRVLGPDGRPYDGLHEVDADDAPLGAAVPGSAPSALPPDSEAFLAALPARGPDTELLLGLLQYLDGRQAEGLAHARAAADAAPARTSLLARLSALTLSADYLPDTWQKNRARELASQVVAAQPEHLGMGLYLAGLLADEDQEEDALDKLGALTERHPRQVASLFATQDACEKLEMEARGESALMASRDRQPANPAVLERLAHHEGEHGHRRKAAELSLEALRRSGATGRGLHAAARDWAALGEVERAHELLVEGVARDDSQSLQLNLARFLLEQERWDEADAILATLQVRFPRAVTACLARADVAERRGDRGSEIARLGEALARRPSLKAARERLFALTGAEPTEAFFARQRLDIEAVRAAWSDTGSKDSVVKVLDHGIVKVFPDGGTETYTQDLWQARDLQGCERLGEISLSGDVLRVATIKADGTVFEPVAVNGQYVMPQLKPGDFVVTESRSMRSPPANRIVRTGDWTFASNDHPFQLSRYAISVPKALGLRLVERNGPVSHVETDAGDAVEHVFEARDQARVLVEPGAPPAPWYLPWVEFGMDGSAVSAKDAMAATVLEPTRVTPEIAAAAAGAIAGVPGDEARARALHALVNATLDKRGYQSATEGLLAHEGNGTWLYAALLTAADVPHEIVWTRNMAPESDHEPDPPFLAPGFYARKLLLLVQPRDGQPAWCDMDLKAMPYGKLVGNAPRAPALALPSQREFTLPDVPLAEQPTAALDLAFQLMADGSATVKGRVDLKAGFGYLLKEQIRDIPAAMHKLALTQAAAQLVPGLDISSYKLAGLDEMDPPLAISAEGRIASFLDDDGHGLTCKLPVPKLDLAEKLAGGEGVRKLPYFLDDPQVWAATVHMQLGEGLAFGALPASHRAEFHGGTYELSFDREGERGLAIRRELLLPPFSVPADEYPIFAAFCARIDEAERAQLRFTRTTAAPGAPAGDGSATSDGPPPAAPASAPHNGVMPAAPHDGVAPAGPRDASVPAAPGSVPAPGSVDPAGQPR